MNELISVTIEKLIEGGQGLGQLPNGKKVFVWNALPGEQVNVRMIKQKSSYAEAIAEEIVTPSSERIAPLEPETYLATSPWQMMTFAAENTYKKQLVEDIFTHAKVAIPSFQLSHDEHEMAYRNKIEFGFWGDDDGLHLAGYRRGSHGKQVVEGSALAMPALNDGAQSLLKELQQLNPRAGDLKTMILRCSGAGAVVASLFVKREDFHELSLPSGLQGLRVYYSNPKSPASVRTRLLQEMGDVLLYDTLLGQSFVYDVDSFFQVNLPIYEQALQRVKSHMQTPRLVDMYAGVGSIGLSVATEQVTLVELDAATAHMADENAATSGLAVSVVETSSEHSLEYITHDVPVIVDPPRAGLHPDVVAQLCDAKPPKIAYLSCNPATQARDLAILSEHYAIDHFEAFNFFPRTPHIETLAILTRRA